MQVLPWIVALAALLLLAASLAGWPARGSSRRERAPSLPTDWDLTSRPVFSSDERRLYRALRVALPHHVLLPKLPLVRFCHPTDPNDAADWHRLLDTIDVGFAICSENGRVLTAIDLEVERRPSRREAQIKRQVLSACRVRYLRCAADHLPSIAELQLLVPRGAIPATAPHPLESPPRQSPVQRPATRAGLWQEPPVFHDSFFNAAGRAAAESRNLFADSLTDDHHPGRDAADGPPEVRGPQFASAGRR